MMNINKIMKESVTINFNMDINELNDELAIDTYTIVIPTKDIREEVSIDDLNREFNLGISNVKITEEKISMDYFTCETIFIRTLKECQKDIDTMVKIISNKLDKFKINNFELICNYYTWID